MGICGRRPAIAAVLRDFYATLIARIASYVPGANQRHAADLEQRAWLFVALLEGASVLRAIGRGGNHDQALRSALRPILAG